jgi:hypothetical protein
MKIARAVASAAAVTVLLVAADAAQAWVPPHLIERPTAPPAEVPQIVREAPPLLRMDPQLEGDAAYGAADPNQGDQLTTLREQETKTLDDDAHALAGSDALEKVLRNCIKGMLEAINQETIERGGQATAEQDSLLGAMVDSLENCLKGQLAGPVGQAVGVATDLTQQQEQAVAETSVYLAVQARNGITSAARIDPDPAVLTRWANGDSGTGGEPVTNDPIGVEPADDSGGSSKRVLILGAVVAVFIALFGLKKLFD